MARFGADARRDATTALDKAADADLVLRTRSGDAAAFGELWRRHYRSGLAVAASVTQSFDADDLVQEAYARIYQSIRAGGGPTGAFRAYLFTSIRNTAAAWGRASRESASELLDTVEDPSSTEQATADALDRGLTARAFRSLPTRWQEVLWYTEIEQLKPAEVAPLLGMKAAAVAQLAYRAREGLREAWVQAHLQSLPEGSECAWTVEHLGAYARGGLAKRDTARLELHLGECVRCAIVAGEAKEVSHRLALVLLPLTVGVAGGGAYLATVQTGGAPVATAAAMPSWVTTGAVTGVAAPVAGVAAAGTAGVAGGAGIASGLGALIGVAAAGIVVAAAALAAGVAPALLQNAIAGSAASHVQQVTPDSVRGIGSDALIAVPPAGVGGLSPVSPDTLDPGAVIAAPPVAPVAPIANVPGVIAPVTKPAHPGTSGTAPGTGGTTTPGGGSTTTPPTTPTTPPTTPTTPPSTPPTTPPITPPVVALPPGAPSIAGHSVTGGNDGIALSLRLAAAPGATVQVLVADAVVATVTADSSGAASAQLAIGWRQVATDPRIGVRYVAGDRTGPVQSVRLLKLLL